MGEVEIGDNLVDERGLACRVTYATPWQYNRKCYELRFTDGTTIVADADHQWTVTLRSRSGLSALRQQDFEFNGQDYRGTLTTDEMRSVLFYGKRGDRNVALPSVEPIQTPHSKLPLAPYALGLWLGDGSQGSGYITCSIQDRPAVMQCLREVGVRSVERDHKSPAVLLGDGDRTQAARNQSPQAALRRLRVLRDKHIPRRYLRASVEQRRELLQGLMDSDGYVSKAGQCEFTTTNHVLATDTVELIRSLGIKATVTTARATLYGKDCGPKYRVQFFAWSDEPCFRLPRKRARLRQRPTRQIRSATRKVVAIREVFSRPVRCVQVDSPSRLYLAGEGMVPTHNTQLAAGIGLACLYTDGENGAQVYCTGYDREQAGILYDAASAMVEQCPALRRTTKALPSKKRLLYRPRSSAFVALPASEKGGHGLNTHCAVYDELHLYRTARHIEVYESIHTSTLARDQPLEVIATTAGYDRESLCYEVYEHACRVRDGRADDRAFLPLVCEAPRGADWTDPAVWALANPNLGVTFPVTYLEDECAQAKANPRLENTFRRLHLNQWTSQQTRFISMLDYDECWGTPGPLDPAVDTCGGLDLSQVEDLTAFVMVQRRPGGGYRCRGHYWVPHERLQAMRGQGLAVDRWIREGWLTPIPGAVIEDDFVFHWIVKEHQRGKLREVGFDPAHARQLRIRLEAAGVTMVEVRQGAFTLGEPMRAMEKAIKSGQLDHSGDPVLAWCMENLEARSDDNGNVRPVKPADGSQKKIDGVSALLNGLQRLIATPAPRVLTADAVQSMSL